MGARAEALSALRSDFVSGRGLLHELAQAAGFRMSDIAGEVARDGWYQRRALAQRGLPADAAPTAESRCLDILTALEEVARAWVDEALLTPGKAKPLELRAMVHMVRDLLETTQQVRSGSAAEPPPPRRFTFNGRTSSDSALREDNDSRFAS